MVTSVLWNALRSRLAQPKPARGVVALQHLGLSDRDLGDLRPVLDKVGDELAVDIELHGHTGDIVLLDVPFAARLSPQLVTAFAEGRPVVLLGDGGEGVRDVDPALGAALRLERRQQALLRQLREIALVRARSADADNPHWAPPSAMNSSQLGSTGNASGFDPAFDSRIDADQLLAAAPEESQREVLQHVLRAALQSATRGSAAASYSASYSASYGPDANVLFDFRARLVFLDPLAQQHLRVKRELPQPAPGARPHADALVRELDETLWDLGVAAGPFPLLDEPANWWRCPLRLTDGAQVERYSRIPRNLDLARRLAQGPAAPSELRRHAHVSVADLRRFIQAALMTGAVEWAPSSAPAATPEPATLNPRPGTH